MLTVPVPVPPQFTYSSKKKCPHCPPALISIDCTQFGRHFAFTSSERHITRLLHRWAICCALEREGRMRQWKMAITRSVRGCALWTGQDEIALANPRNTVLRLTPDMTAVTQGQRWTQCGWRVLQFTGWVVTAKHWMTGIQAQCPVSSDAVQSSELRAPVAQWLTVNHDNCRHCFCFCWCVP